MSWEECSHRLGGMITVKKKARPWRRIYKFDLLLDPLVIACVVTVVMQRLLRSVPQLFPGGALLGDVIAALALSFIGAWFFNLLVIRLPKVRDKRSFAEVSGHLLADYSLTAVKILQAMAAETGAPPPPRRPDQRYLKDLLSRVRPMDIAPKTDVAGTKFNWLQFTNSEIEDSASLRNRLQPFFPQLDVATTAAIAAVENCHISRISRVLAMSPPMSNPDLSGLADLYLDLWRACTVVGDRYLIEIAPLVSQDERIDIDRLEGAPPPPPRDGERRWVPMTTR
ncbi:hypothetical protein GCM10025792_18500 [Pseudonocardia tropica]